MFHVCVVTEDTTLTATQVSESDETGAILNGRFHVTVTDAHSGKIASITCTLQQVTAIFALGFGSVGEDKTPGYDSNTLYSQINGLFDGWPRECLPVP